MAIRVAINGFGRIGRLVFRLMKEDPSFDVIAINDLTDASQLAYLLKYDTSHRRYKVNEITNDDNNIIINGDKIRIYSESDPLNLHGMNLVWTLYLNVLDFLLVRKKQKLI